MAGIAFWGGFASGMSKSIERNRDRKMKQDQIQEANRQAENKSIAKQKTEGYKTVSELQKKFSKINEDIEKIRSGDYKGTDDERIDAVNAKQQEKIDVYSQAAEYAANLGFDLQSDGGFDVMSTGVGQISVYERDGEKYLLNKELKQSIDESNGQLVVIGDEVKARKMKEENGRFVPDNDANGNPQYESTGEVLTKYSDMFQAPKSDDPTRPKYFQEKLALIEKRRKQNGVLDEADQVRLNEIDNYLGTDADEKRKDRSKRKFIIQKYVKKPSALDNIKDDDISELQLQEENSNFKGIGDTEKKNLRDMETTLFSGKRLMRKLGAIDSEEMERGVFDNMVSMAKKNISDTAWDSLSSEEKQSTLLTVGVNTSLGSALADYIKSISGTAVAEAEYNRLAKIFTAGNYTNIASLKEAIGTFYGDLENKYSARLRGSIEEGGSFILRKIKKLKRPSYESAMAEVQADPRTKNWSPKDYENYMTSIGY